MGIWLCLKIKEEQKACCSSLCSLGTGGGVDLSEAGCQVVSQDCSWQSPQIPHRHSQGDARSLPESSLFCVFFSTTIR